jgi:hypothetical protein
MSALPGRVAAPLALILSTAFLGACAGPATAPPRLSTQVAPLAAIPAAAVATARFPDLGALKGLRPVEIVALLGQPELKRDEPPAELWQYRTTDCVLNLFFYREAGLYRLLSAESWTRATAASSAPAPCRADGAPVGAHTATQSAL